MPSLASDNAEPTIEQLKADLRALWMAGDAISICEICDAWLTVEERATVDDVSVCPKEAYGSVRFPNEPCYRHRAWLVLEDRATPPRT